MIQQDTGNARAATRGVKAAVASRNLKFSAGGDTLNFLRVVTP
jgi:hypothetical protein